MQNALRNAPSSYSLTESWRDTRITPGIRFDDASKGDQVRVTTPALARELGSDYIVVGRPVTAADDPVAAYARCVKDFLGEEI